MHKLLNASTLLGFTTLIALVGVSTKNPYLAITGLNLGMSTGIATFVDKKAKDKQQESRIVTEVSNIHYQLEDIKHQAQEQHLLLSKYQQNLDQIELLQNKSLETQDFVTEISNISNQIKEIKEQSQDQYLLLGQHQENLNEIEIKQNKLLKTQEFSTEISQINDEIKVIKEEVQKSEQSLTTAQPENSNLQLQQVLRAVDSLYEQIKTIEQQSQQQSQLLNQYQENLQNIESQRSQNLDTEQFIAELSKFGEQIKTIEQQSQQQSQLLNQYQESLQNIESQQNTISKTQQDIQLSQIKHHNTLTKKQKTLEHRFSKRELQIDKQNKKIKENKYNINTQKAKQNRIISIIQELEKQDLENIVINDYKLNGIEKQVDKIIEITSQIQKENPVNYHPQTIVYIDNNNLYKCLEKINIKIDYQSLFVKLTQEFGATQVKLYDGFFANQISKRTERERLGYQVFGFPIVEQRPGIFKTVGDDVKLAIDMVNDVKSGDNVILMTGDGDFHPAVKKVKLLQNVNVTVIAQDNSISHYLREVADEFISLDSIKYDIAKYKLYIY